MDTVNEECMATMAKTRTHVHRWGARNRVPFEASKESIAVIHPRDGEGEPFKVLGCMFDVHLKMALAVDKVVTKVRSKVQAMLRTVHIYSEKK